MNDRERFRYHSSCETQRGGTLSLQGLQSLQKRLEKMKGDLEEAGTEAADDALDATERNAKIRLSKNDAVASGQLYNSFVQSTIKMPNKTRKKLGNEAAHANVVEWGSGQQFGSSKYSEMPDNGPYKAPSFSQELVTAIKQWIVVKPTFRPKDYGNLEDAAVGIAVHISLNGTPSQPFMRPAWRHGKRVLDHQLRTNIEAAVR